MGQPAATSLTRMQLNEGKKQNTEESAGKKPCVMFFFNYLQIEQFQVMISSLLDDFAIKIFLFIFRSRHLLAIKIIRKLFGSGQCRDLVFSRWRCIASDGMTPGQTRAALNLLSSEIQWHDGISSCLRLSIVSALSRIEIGAEIRGILINPDETNHVTSS